MNFYFTENKHCSYAFENYISYLRKFCFMKFIISLLLENFWSQKYIYSSKISCPKKHGIFIGALEC